MALEPQQRARDDGYPEEKVLVSAEASAALLAPSSQAPVSQWRPVAVVVLGMGLLLSGTNILRWRTVEPPRAEAPKEETRALTLEPGSPHEFEVPGVMRMAVGSPDVVDAHLVDERKLKVEPLGPGTTTLLLWMRDGTRRTYTVTVRAR